LQTKYTVYTYYSNEKITRVFKKIFEQVLPGNTKAILALLEKSEAINKKGVRVIF
jgi:hypothetical protein